MSLRASTCQQQVRVAVSRHWLSMVIFNIVWCLLGSATQKDMMMHTLHRTGQQAMATSMARTQQEHQHLNTAATAAHRHSHSVVHTCPSTLLLRRATASKSKPCMMAVSSAVHSLHMSSKVNTPPTANMLQQYRSTASGRWWHAQPFDIAPDW